MLRLVPDLVGGGSEPEKETGGCDRNKLADVRKQRVGECRLLTDAKQCEAQDGQVLKTSHVPWSSRQHSSQSDHDLYDKCRQKG